MSNYCSPDGEFATRDCASCGKEIRQQRCTIPQLRHMSPKFKSWEQVSKYCRQCYRKGIKEAVEYYDGTKITVGHVSEAIQALNPDKKKRLEVFEGKKEKP